jgi:lysozyme
MAPNQKKTAGWLALTIAAVGAYEGLSLTAYPDIIGVPTDCYGETRGVHLGDVSTKDQCDAKLSARLVEFNKGVNSCVTVPLPDTRRAAFVSLAYNIGVPAFCSSTTVKRINAGDVVGACEAMTRFNMAGGKVVQGLVNRRASERELCIRGVL